MKLFYSVYFTLVLVNSLKISGSKLHKRKKSSSCSTQHVCEESTLHLSCKSNDVIEIESALYGRTTYSVCYGSLQFRRNCRAPSAFDIVSERCTGNPSCNVHANNSVFGGDPCRFTYKYLEVTFCCIKKEDKTKGHTSTINAQTISIGRSETDSEVSSYSDQTTSEGQRKESNGPGNNSDITTIVIIDACLIVTVVILSIGIAANKFKKSKRNQGESVNSTSQVTSETHYVDNNDYDVMRTRRVHILSAEDQNVGEEYGTLSNDYALPLVRKQGTLSNDYSLVRKQGTLSNEYALCRKQGIEMADISCSYEYGTLSSDHAMVRKQETEMSVASCSNEYDIINRQGLLTTAPAENVYGVAHGQQLGDLSSEPIPNEYAVAYTCKRGTEVTSILTDGDEYTVVNRKGTDDSMTEPNDYEFASVNAKL